MNTLAGIIGTVAAIALAGYWYWQGKKRGYALGYVDGVCNTIAASTTLADIGSTTHTSNTTTLRALAELPQPKN